MSDHDAKSIETKHILDGRMSGTLERWRWREAAKYVKPGDSVLDIACNEGGFIDYLPAQTTYLGTDISPSALEYARAAHPNYTFILADLSQATPDIEQTFDVAVMLAFIEHLAEPQHIVSSVRSLLKPGGKIIITTPAPWARPVHDIGSQLGIFSREGAEDHEKFLGKRALYQLAHQTHMEVTGFHYFMYGFNQVLLLRKRENDTI